ncbi:MAG: uncharacterized protein QOK05_57 [Chloroflexota bacterium]|nr:uncharacterized protein [Chloroflexota bacterium]
MQLLDAYGNLLTAHQREAVRLHLAEDWSFAEIATAQGISRAAAHDLVRRAQVALAGYEAKLGLRAAQARRDNERSALQARIDQLESEVKSLRRAVKGLS